MTVFAVQYTYVDDLDALDAHRPAHRDFLRVLAERDVCVLAGAHPNEPGLPAAALLLIRGDSADEVRELLAQDPFQREGLVAEAVIRPWTPPLGSWVAQDGAPLSDRF